MNPWDYLEGADYYQRFDLEWDETLDYILMLLEEDD